MSFLRSRAKFKDLSIHDSDSDDETPGQADKNVLYRTTGTALRNSQHLVGTQIVNPKLSQERRNKARDALEALKGAGDKMNIIKLLSNLANSPVTDIVPASAASQGRARLDDLPSVPKVDHAAFAAMPSADNQTSLIRSRWFGKAKARAVSISDFRNFMPIQYEFPPHPAGDRSNEWFQDQYARLFDRIAGFAQDFFAYHDLQTKFHEPWAVDMPDEFYRYVELVAEPDPAVGGWDEMLEDTETRKFLIVGIIVRILEVKVFAPNLWGNTREGEELLHNLDRALLDSEGYSRQELRSKSIRTLLGGASITPNFHKDCTHLTVQILLLFLPLFNYLTTLPKNTPPQPTALYQSLHNIISTAAYISLCIRVSPTIIHITHLVPGTPYNPDEHTSILQRSWTVSKNVVNETWTKEHEVLEIERAAAEGYKLGYENAGPGRITSKAGTAAVERFKAAQKALGEHRPPSYTHRASVKIAIWPVTRRYWAGNGKPGGEMDGQSVFSVTNAGAVFYYKKTDAQVPSLFAFVAEKKKRFRRGLRMLQDAAMIFGIFALSFLLVSLLVVGFGGVAVLVGNSMDRVTGFLQSLMRKGKGGARVVYEFTGAPGKEWLKRRRDDPYGSVEKGWGKAKEGAGMAFEWGSDQAVEGLGRGLRKAGYLYGYGAERARRTIENPWGLGLRGLGERANVAFEGMGDRAEEGVGGALRKAEEVYSQAKEKAGKKAGSVLEAASSYVDKVTHGRAGEVYEQAKEKASEKAEALFEAASSYVEKVAQTSAETAATEE